MDAYEKNRRQDDLGREILVVRHQTFEQAASCFPNSLSVILNFYEERPIGTRTLSYAIKEDFSSGTFIWKAESFLEKNGYELLTTYWQNKQTLISLIDAGYPVLVYIPGHVYTVYGYDSRMEMFFTYDTAESNRWSDKPFWDLQRDWMMGRFLMSVVIPKDKKQDFTALFPQLEQYRHNYQLWQKTQISDYYAQKGNYWKDYDRYALSKTLGLDRLKVDRSYFLHPLFSPFPWDAEDWETAVSPVLNNPWALEWSLVENYVLYLLYNGQSERALQVMERYQSDVAEEESYGHDGLLELKLAAKIDVKDMAGVLSVSDKLIGITDNLQEDAYWGYLQKGSYWGHYFKARHLMAAGDLKQASETLLSALKRIELDQSPNPFGRIVDAMDEIHRLDPSLFEPKDLSLMKVAQIDLASDR